MLLGAEIAKKHNLRLALIDQDAIITMRNMSKKVKAREKWKIVLDIFRAPFSKKLKTGSITYFVDVKEAKNNTRYVSITESQPSKDDPKKFSKRSITVFNNAANDFVGALEEAVGHLK